MKALGFGRPIQRDFRGFAELPTEDLPRIAAVTRTPAPKIAPVVTRPRAQKPPAPVVARQSAEKPPAPVVTRPRPKTDDRPMISGLLKELERTISPVSTNPRKLPVQEGPTFRREPLARPVALPKPAPAPAIQTMIPTAPDPVVSDPLPPAPPVGQASPVAAQSRPVADFYRFQPQLGAASKSSGIDQNLMLLLGAGLVMVVLRS